MPAFNKIAKYLYILSLLILPSAAYGNKTFVELPNKLVEGWSYSLTDSQSTKNWLPMTKPFYSHAASTIWYKVKLPSYTGLHHLFFKHVNQCFTVNNREKSVLANFGKRRNGSCIFTGWQSQIIELPDNFANQELFFRVEASYPFVGFKEFPDLVPYEGLLLSILSADIRNISITIFYGVFALIILTSSFVLKNKKPSFLLGFVVLNIGLYFFGQTKIKYFLVPLNEHWVYIEYWSLALMPYSFLTFMEFAGSNEFKNISSLFRKIFLVFMLPYLMVGMIDIKYLVTYLIYLQIVIFIGIVAYFTMMLVRQAYKSDTILALANFCLIFTSAFGLIGNIFNIEIFGIIFGIGMVIFLLILVFKVSKDYHQNIIYLADLKSREHNRQIHLFSERMKIINTLASGMAHEINNPLFIISGRVGILEKRFSRDCDQDNSHHLSSIRSAVTRISNIINKLQSFENIRLQSEAAEILLKEMMNLIIDQFSTSIKNNKITISTFIESDDVIIGNKKNLFHAILAIFENAVNYSSLANIPEIKIQTFSSKSCLRILIENNGPEIHKTIQERISDPFFSTSFSNTGLGLTVATNILRNIGGNLYLKQSNSKKTVFVMEIPRIEKNKNQTKTIFS